MATASAGRADKGSSRGSRAFRAPLQRARLAVGGQGRGEGKPKARQPSSCAQTQGATMSDPEIEDLRNKVHCAVVLERTPPPWMLDRKESTKLSLKYRRGKGEILIVSHGGKGWWDPTSDAKGDVFSLVQRLEPGVNFGHVRKRLREFAGLTPSFPIAERAGCRKASDRPVAERWADRKAVWSGSPTWRYLARERFLPSAIIEAASAAGVLREGPAGSAWFAHFNGAGFVAHVDIRGPTYKGSLAGGAKSLFRLPPSAQSLPRLVLAEAAVDALSVAAIESLRADTLYAASGGGMGRAPSPRSRRCLQPWRRSRAPSSAAPRTPMDRAIASQNDTDRSRKNSACRSRGFGLQSMEATGMTSFALAHNFRDCRHDSRHHGLRLERRTPRRRAAQIETSARPPQSGPERLDR
jgi:hypothetical protein